MNKENQPIRVERLSTLAFSMYSNKGAYALLLGAGISIPAKIPCGWDIEEDLIQKLGYIQEATETENGHQWYQEKYNKPVNYSILLEEVASTPTERVQLMKPYFEPTEEEKSLGWKSPTKAHIAIARLAKAGYIRIILTTNFDRLLEQAFAQVGITPQVISHEGAIAQATPIVHSDRPIIIKINGDYIDCQFRNTTEELDEYPEQMELYLRRIFEDFGLISCGWSANWDRGLIKIINSTTRPRYNSFFSTIGEATEGLTNLAITRSGEIMPIESADHLFSELYEQVMALEKYHLNRQMGHEMRLARAKKYLSSDEYRIEFADLIEKLGDEAYRKVNEVANYNFILTEEQFDRYLDIHRNAISPLLEIAILTVRWGKESQIMLFGDILVKLCLLNLKHGDRMNVATKVLHSLAPILLFNAIGIACVKYEKFKELNTILSLSVPANNFIGTHRPPLLNLLGTMRWDKGIWRGILRDHSIFPFSLFSLDKLRPFFNGYFTSEPEYKNTFCIWEHLMSLVYGYNKCYPIADRFYIPLGIFIKYREEYNATQNYQEPYTLFFKEAEDLKDNWKPLKQGMFGRSYDNYKRIYDTAEEYYDKHRGYWYF